MRKILLLVCFVTSLSNAQTPKNPVLSFETPFYEAVDQWVLYPASGEHAYSLGFIYVDRSAGFTFDYETRLVLENEKLINPNPERQKEAFVKSRLERNSANVHILSEEQLNELNLTTPKWLEVYKRNSDTEGYQIDIASWYNNAGGSEIALGILKELFENNKTDGKLLFELSYAYNALGRHPEALEVLEIALQVNDTEELYYKEKLYAYAMLVDFEAAKKWYAIYLKKTKSYRYRSEIVYNLAYSHFLGKDLKGFNYWRKLLRSLENKEHILVKNLEMMKQNWDEPR